MIDNVKKNDIFYFKLDIDPIVKRSLKELTEFRDNSSEEVEFNIELKNYENSKKFFIKYLCITNNSKIPLPNDLFFGDISELIIVDFSSNNKFYDSVFSNKKLLKLSLTLYNDINTLPDKFDVFSKLTVLAIQIPSLTIFPQSIGKLRNLDALVFLVSALDRLSSFFYNFNSDLKSLLMGYVKRNNETILSELKNLQLIKNPTLLFED